jgi:hypothetical protein
MARVMKAGVIDILTKPERPKKVISGDYVVLSGIGWRIRVKDESKIVFRQEYSKDRMTFTREFINSTWLVKSESWDGKPKHQYFSTYTQAYELLDEIIENFRVDPSLYGEEGRDTACLR